MAKQMNGSFTDNSSVVLRKIGTNCKAAMDAAALLLVEAVQNKIMYGYEDLHGDPPHTEIVDTGALFDSITASVKRAGQNAYSVTVGTNRPYAIYVHEGTYKLKGRPFITDGVMDAQDDLKTTLSTNISIDFGAGGAKSTTT